MAEVQNDERTGTTIDSVTADVANRQKFSNAHDSLLTILQELIQLELLCKNLYESTDAAERSKAEASLNVFYMSPDCLQKCQLLLERGDVSGQPVMSSTPFS